MVRIMIMATMLLITSTTMRELRMLNQCTYTGLPSQPRSFIGLVNIHSTIWIGATHHQILA